MQEDDFRTRAQTRLHEIDRNGDQANRGDAECAGDRAKHPLPVLRRVSAAYPDERDGDREQEPGADQPEEETFERAGERMKHPEEEPAPASDPCDDDEESSTPPVYRAIPRPHERRELQRHQNEQHGPRCHMEQRGHRVRGELVVESRDRLRSARGVRFGHPECAKNGVAQWLQPFLEIAKMDGAKRRRTDPENQEKRESRPHEHHEPSRHRSLPGCEKRHLGDGSGVDDRTREEYRSISTGISVIEDR